MKKLISVLLVLALTITSIISFNTTDVNAATTKTGPSIKTSNCTVSSKKVYVGSSIRDCIDKVYYKGSETKGQIKVTKLNKNSYLEITAPEAGILFLQMVDGDMNDGYTIGTRSTNSIFYKDGNDIINKYPITSDYDKLVNVGEIALGTTYGIKQNIFISSNKIDSISQYNMAKNEKVYLHFCCSSTATIKLSWISTSNLISIEDFGDTARINFKVNTGIVVPNSYSSILTFMYQTTDVKTLGDFYKDDQFQRGAWRYSEKSDQIALDNKQNYTYVKSYIETPIRVNEAGVITINIAIPYNKNLTLPVVIKKYYSNIIKYNKAYLSSNSPSQPLYMKNGTNVIFGYDSTGKEIKLVYNKKTYTVKSDSNGFYSIILNTKLTKGKNVDLYYTEKGTELTSSYTVQ